MLILAFETSAKAGSVALLENGKLLGESYQNTGMTHSQTLMVMAEDMLKAAGKTVSDLTAVAVAEGPGSFTGVRIGVATIKGLAFGQNKPCAGVSTLEALAYNLCDYDGLICPVMNARRQQVYTALFRAKDGKLERLMPDSAIAIAELDQKLSQYNEPVRLCGDGYDVTLPFLTHEVIPTSERYRHQSGYAVAQVAKRMFDAGEACTDITVSPVYLRLSQAERERAERMGGVDTGI